jgi:hypothetical protein
MRAIVTLVLLGSLLLPIPSYARQDVSLNVDNYWSFEILAAVKVPVFSDVIHLAALDDGRVWLVVIRTLTNTYAQDQVIHSDRVQLRSGGEMIKQTRRESEDVAAALGGKSIGGDRHTVPADQVLEVAQVSQVAPDAPDVTPVIDFTHGWEIPIDGFLSASAGDPGALVTVATAVEAVTRQATQASAQETELIVAIREADDSGISGDATLSDNGDGTTTIDILVSGATGDHFASLRSGTCADLGGVIAPLTEVDPDGASVTDVPFELSVIQDPHVGPHAVAISRSVDESSAVVACGDVPLVPVEPIQLIDAEVVEIVDARTLLVEIAGEEHTVVLIGVDPRRHPSATATWPRSA